MKRLKKLALLITFALLSSFALSAQLPASANTSYIACLKTKSGEIRLVIKGKKCVRGEKKVKISLAGPKGEVGDSGPRGEKGEKGEVGDAGPKGATGAAGSSGGSGPQGPAGPTGATGSAGPIGAALVHKLPTNFNQKFLIDKTGFGCCERSNRYLGIHVKFRNTTNNTISRLTSDNLQVNPNTATQIWLQYYDVNGDIIGNPQTQSNAFPVNMSAVQTNWNLAGDNWINNAETEWFIYLDLGWNDVPSLTPEDAVYVAVVFRFLNLRIIDGNNAFVANVGQSQYLDANEIFMTSFTASLSAD